MIKKLFKRKIKRSVNKIVSPNSKRNKLEKRIKNIAFRSLRIASRKLNSR